MSSAEQQIEQEIQDKGLNAPRLTPEYIDLVIQSVHYFTAGDGYVGELASSEEFNSLPESERFINPPQQLDILTFCVIVLKNGFTVTGESACASPENFDAEVGRKIAYKNAREKIWELEGYLLKQQIHHEAKMKEYFAEQGVSKDAVFVGIDLASNGEPPILGNKPSDPTPNLQSCSGSVSYGNTNHRTIELLLDILRTTNVGSDVSDKARTKLSELVDKI